MILEQYCRNEPQERNVRDCGHHDNNIGDISGVRCTTTGTGVPSPSQQCHKGESKDRPIE